MKSTCSLRGPVDTLRLFDLVRRIPKSIDAAGNEDRCEEGSGKEMRREIAMSVLYPGSRRPIHRTWKRSDRTVDLVVPGTLPPPLWSDGPTCPGGLSVRGPGIHVATASVGSVVPAAVFCCSALGKVAPWPVPTVERHCARVTVHRGRASLSPYP